MHLHTFAYAFCICVNAYANILMYHIRKVYYTTLLKNYFTIFHISILKSLHVCRARTGFKLTKKIFLSNVI